MAFAASDREEEVDGYPQFSSLWLILNHQLRVTKTVMLGINSPLFS